jgi:hypothetical protein
MKERKLFVCFVCHIEISKTIVLLAVLLILLENYQYIGVHLSWFHNVSTYNGKVIEY